jgi:hypothetical protein
MLCVLVVSFLTNCNTADGFNSFIHSFIHSCAGTMFVGATTRDLSDSGIPVTTLVDRWKPEIDACLEASFYALSTSFKATPGMKAFGISFSKKGNPYLLGLLILCKWLYCRIHRISIYKNWRAAAEGSLAKKLWRMIKVMDAVMHILSFANQMSFISASVSSETYPDLTSRLSGYGYMPLHPNNNSEIIAPLQHMGSGQSAEGGDGKSRGAGSGAVGIGASRAEAQLMVRHAAWEVLQGLVMASALFCDWKKLSITLKRFVIDVYYRAYTFLKKCSFESVLDSMPIQKKYIPEIFLQLFQSAPTRKAAKRDGNQGAEKDDVDETRDSAGCAICGQEPPEVRHCHHPSIIPLPYCSQIC